LQIYHGDTEAPSLLRQGYEGRERKYKCGVYFVHAGTRDQNKRHGFLKEYVEGDELSILPRLSHGMALRNRRGIFGSGTPERKCRDIFFWVLLFSVPLCLCGKSFPICSGLVNVPYGTDMHPPQGRTTKFFYEFEPYYG
jgi:hypothetical protein